MIMSSMQLIESHLLLPGLSSDLLWVFLEFRLADTASVPQQEL